MRYVRLLAVVIPHCGSVVQWLGYWLVTPGIGVQFSVEPPIMWMWYNGCAPAFQAGDVGSIPSIHSRLTVCRFHINPYLGEKAL